MRGLAVTGLSYDGLGEALLAWWGNRPAVRRLEPIGLDAPTSCLICSVYTSRVSLLGLGDEGGLAEQDKASVLRLGRWLRQGGYSSFMPSTILLQRPSLN